MNATKTDIYNALAEAVKFSPFCSDRCKQLQTFRVIEQGFGGQLTAANFGATLCDKDKPHFWSRAWYNSGFKEKIIFDFPVLAVIDTNFTVDKPLDNKSTRCYDFNITVLDKYTEDCTKGKCGGCNGRTIREIHEDTEKLLFSALNFLSGLVEATLPDGSTGIFNKDMLDAWVDKGFISDYSPMSAIGDLLMQKIRNASAYNAAITTENLYGTSITLTVCLQPCETNTYDFNNPDFVEISRQSGCNNCG